jgi:hypothetical protein
MTFVRAGITASPHGRPTDFLLVYHLETEGPVSRLSALGPGCARFYTAWISSSGSRTPALSSPSARAHAYRGTRKAAQDPTLASP